MATHVGVLVDILQLMCHVEQKAIAIDVIAEFRCVVRLPSEDDVAVVFGVGDGFQMIWGLTGDLVTTCIINGA